MRRPHPCRVGRPTASSSSVTRLPISSSISATDRTSRSIRASVDAFQLVAVLLEDAVGAIVGLAEDAADLLVDHLGGVLGVVARLAHLAAEERMLLGVAEEDRADALAHARTG